MNILEVIKDIVSKIIEAETITPYGKVNLIGGIVIAIFMTVILVPNTALIIAQCFFKEIDFLIPWYGAVGCVLLLIVFFWVCIKYVSDIKENWDNFKSSPHEDDKK